jgi:sugar phosphate isomerase/epimerase
MLTRRRFLFNTGALALGAAILPSYKVPFADVKNPGIQLYTFRNEMMADAVGTLKKIASLGFKQIESASSSKGHYYGLKPKEMKMICNDLGMTLRSGHVGIDAKWQQTMDEAAESGQEYLVCSSMPISGQTVDNYKKVSEIFNESAAALKKLDIQFAYHNHDAEFEMDNGEVLYDVLLQHTDASLVKMEMDLGWVVVAGKDPLVYFKNHPGRFPLWHLKDMNLVKKHSTEFGKGSLPIKDLLNHSKDAGLKCFFVEQEEYSVSPEQSMKDNMDYLRTIQLNN